MRLAASKQTKTEISLNSYECRSKLSSKTSLVYIDVVSDAFRIFRIFNTFCGLDKAQTGLTKKTMCVMYDSG